MTNQPSTGRSEHGFQPIGASLPRISPTLKARGMSSQKLSIMESTLPRTTGKRTRPAPTGIKVSSPGSSTISIGTDPQELAELTTGALMKALEASLPPPLVLQPLWKDGETKWEMPLRYTAVGTTEEKSMARTVIDRTMIPLPAKKMAQELTKMNALTKRRKEDRVDTELLVAAYVEKLAPYPGEAVIYVLRKWPETQDGKWWPAWSDLYEMLEYRVGERRLILEALG